MQISHRLPARVDAPSGAPVKLTTTPADAMAPVPTRDGSKIIFADGVDQVPGLSRDLFVVDRDGQNLTRLSNRPELSWQAAVAPDNSRVAYVVEKDGHADIHLMDLDGANDVNLTRTNEGFWDPSWSPDGKTIVATWANRAQRNLEVVSIDVASGKISQLTDTRVAQSQSPHFTPDGQHVLFTSDRHQGIPQLFVMNTDGSNVHNLTPDLMMLDGGTASADGHVVFSAQTRAGDTDIYSVSLTDGAPPKQLENSGFALSPSFSPDGSHIAFLAYDAEQNMQIMEADSDGAHPHQVTNDGAFHIYPTYMPDGNTLTFVSDLSGKTEVYTVDLSASRADEGR